MKLPEPLKSGWKSARLLIAFHRSRSGERHDEPRLWRPKDGSAALPTGPEKEVFVVVRGEGEAGDVQIRMQPDRIVLRRDEDAIGWTGIQADHHGVSVLVGDVWITVGADGSVKRQASGDDTSWVEADGTFIRVGSEAEIVVSGDGCNLSRRTGHRLDAITADGVISRRRDRPLDGG